MTKINITIQDGKVTWIEQQGDQLHNWDELVASVTNIVERKDYWTAMQSGKPA